LAFAHTDAQHPAGLWFSTSKGRKPDILSSVLKVGAGRTRRTRCDMDAHLSGNGVVLPPGNIIGGRLDNGVMDDPFVEVPVY
jgi:hypothetical protein